MLFLESVDEKIKEQKSVENEVDYEVKLSSKDEKLLNKLDLEYMEEIKRKEERMAKVFPKVEPVIPTEQISKSIETEPVVMKEKENKIEETIRPKPKAVPHPKSIQTVSLKPQKYS